MKRLISLGFALLCCAALPLTAAEVPEGPGSAIPVLTHNFETVVLPADFAEAAHYDSFMELDLARLSPLNEAILKGDKEKVYALLATGVDVNQKSLGKTPLIFAARYNRVEIAKVLLKHGADPKIRCDGGHDVIHHAKLSGAKEAQALFAKVLKA